MKTKTIPLTQRQLGWLTFTSLLGLFNLWIIQGTIQNQLSINGLYVVLGVDFMYAILAFIIDGRHDVNPIHWVGYCLKLKDSDKPNSREVKGQ